MMLNRLHHIRSLLIAERNVADTFKRFWLKHLLTASIWWLEKAIGEVKLS